MIGALFREAGLARSIELMDYLRYRPSSQRAHVEWFHFVVRAGDLDCLVNFSLLHDGKRRAAHVVLLTRDAKGHWEGDVDRDGEVRARSGRIGLEIGDATLAFDGAFRVQAACRRRPLWVDLRLQPRSFACLAHNLGSLHWVVAPRLSASGTIVLDGRRLTLRDAPAYHDHNWGELDGRGFAWQWACSLSPGPLSAVLVRVAEHGRTSAQGLLLWQGLHRARSFRDSALSLAEEGWLRPARTLRVPRALSLLDPGLASDVPRRLRIEAQGDGDRLSGELLCHDLARVLVPRPSDLGHTLINEVAAQLTLSGTLRGAAVELAAPAFAEFAGPAS